MPRLTPMIAVHIGAVHVLLLLYGLHDVACGADNQQLSDCVDKPAALLFVKQSTHVRSKWQQLSNSRTKDSGTVHQIDIEAANYGSKLQCLSELAYDPQTNTVSIQQQVEAKGSCNHLRVRNDIVLMVLNHVLASSNTNSQLPRPFKFWVDLTDANVMSKATYRLLSFPVLSFGVGPGNPYAFPIPGLYVMLGIIGATPSLMKAVSDSEPPLQHHGNLARDMASLLNGNVQDRIPWQSKLNDAFFAGECIPSFNPRAYAKDQPSTWFLRGDVCKAAKKVSSNTGPQMTIALHINADETNGCTSTVPFVQQLCDGCKPCEVDKLPEPMDAVEAKYQIYVDGYGPVFDDLYSKLTSNSIVMLVGHHSPTNNSMWWPSYNQWFMPLLQPHTHFMPTTPDTLISSVQWCVDNDQACGEMAERAKSIMRCSVTVDTAQQYLFETLRMVHDTQLASGEGEKEPTGDEDHDPRRHSRVWNAALAEQTQPQGPLIDKRRFYVQSMREKLMKMGKGTPPSEPQQKSVPEPAAQRTEGTPTAEQHTEEHSSMPETAAKQADKSATRTPPAEGQHKSAQEPAAGLAGKTARTHSVK